MTTEAAPRPSATADPEPGIRALSAARGRVSALAEGRAGGGLALFAIFAIAVTAARPYHLIKKIPIPGEGGWDYVAADSEARRLYVSHNTEIVVLDLDTGAIVGKIAGGPDMHGAAIASEFGRGFISESNPGSVVIFDLKTLAKIGEVRVGDDPNGIRARPQKKSAMGTQTDQWRLCERPITPTNSAARSRTWIVNSILAKCAELVQVRSTNRFRRRRSLTPTAAIRTSRPRHRP